MQALRENLPRLQSPGSAAAAEFALPGIGSALAGAGGARLGSLLDRRDCEAKLGALSQNPIVAASLTAAALQYNGEMGSGGAAGGSAARKPAKRKAAAQLDTDIEVHAAAESPLGQPAVEEGLIAEGSSGQAGLSPAAANDTQPPGPAGSSSSSSSAAGALVAPAAARPAPWKDVDPGVVDEEGKVQVHSLFSPSDPCACSLILMARCICSDPCLTFRGSWMYAGHCSNFLSFCACPSPHACAGDLGGGARGSASLEAAGGRQTGR